MLSKKLYFFNEKLKQSEIPVIKDDFDKKLYSTFLSFMDQNKAYYKVKKMKIREVNLQNYLKIKVLVRFHFFQLIKIKLGVIIIMIQKLKNFF